jgi:hypothetical protein
MAIFHRLVTPTYVGGLPANFDYINDPLLNGDSGDPALADIKKATGPNQGTYFVAFQEDASSQNTNRPMLALAENCDYLDNAVDGAMPVVTEVTGVGGVGGTTTLVIADTVFVGKFGTTNDQYNRNRLVSVLASTNDHQIIASGSPVEAQLIHNGAGSNRVGFEATGFYTNPTVTLFPAIPEGTAYRLLYAKKGTLTSVTATTDLDALVKTVISATTRLMFTGGSAWADSTTNPAATVDVQLKKILTDLVALTTGASGAHKVGAPEQLAPFTDAPYTHAAGTLAAQLITLWGLVNAPFRTRTLAVGATMDDGGFRDSIVFLNPSSNFTFTLEDPVVNKGRRLRLVDVSGDMSNAAKSVTVARHVGTAINGGAYDVVLAADYGQWELVSSGYQWYLA